jgi:hypothetical protein
MSVLFSCTSDEKVKILDDFLRNGEKSILPDFSFAGYHYGEGSIPNVDMTIYDITAFGAIADDGLDDTKAIQRVVDFAGQSGGGIVSFPTGRFCVNMDTTQTDIIRINYSNIVLRGTGSGPEGTVIYSGSQTTQAEDNSPWLSPFVFHTGLDIQSTDGFYDINKEPIYARLTQDAFKGDRQLYLNRTDSLKSGDIIVIAMRNTNDEGDLMNHLMKPLKKEYDPFMKSYTQAGIGHQPSFQYFIEVDHIVSNKIIELKQPLRRDLLTRFSAFVVKAPMLKEVGIENFRFECAYKGGYKHHLTREHDYGWGAICLQRVAHEWIRNIHTTNYVQNTHLINSRNVTISDVTMTGFDGHYGAKMYHSCDNLVQDLKVEAKYTHGPGLEGASFGNVFRRINLSNPSPVDLHGIGGKAFCPPMYNLYEEITNLTRMAGGGAPQNIPHAGEYNVFWGLEMTGGDHDGYNELFHSWVWRDPKRFKNELHTDCHKLYLRSIVVGVYHPSKVLSIDQRTDDRADEWIYVEGLNSNMNLPSLYQTQLEHRLKN